MIELTFPNTRLSSVPGLPEPDLHNVAKSFQISANILKDNIIYTGRSIYDIVLELEPNFFHSLVSHEKIDFSKLKDVTTNRGIILTTKGNKHVNNSNISVKRSDSMDGEFDFYLRMFLPRYGINEDHVSGSAYCAVAEYWQQKLQCKLGEQMVGYQSSGRGGKVVVTVVDEKRVVLGGECVTTMRGEIVV